MNHEKACELITRQFESNDLPTEEWEAMRTHVRDCGECRAFYDRHVDLESALAADDVASSPRMKRIHARTAQQLRAPHRGRRPALAVVAPLLAIAAAAVLYVAVRPSSDPDMLTPRGLEQPGSKPVVSVYYLSSEGQPQRLTGRLPKGRPLLFAYTNMSDSPYRHLAIAGVDSSGRAHWYYPAYEHADVPELRSIGIKQGVADRQLEEQVTSEHALGSLEICALFTETPLDVKAVDVALEKERRWPEKAHRDCHRVEVIGE